MIQFCYNDAITPINNKVKFSSLLADSILQYLQIKRKYPEQCMGIVTENNISQISVFKNELSLFDCISSLDKQIRAIGFRLFTKYPFEEVLLKINEKDLVQNQYSTIVNGIAYDAFNHKIVYDNSGILFTVPTHNDLEKDRIVFSENKTTEFENPNLFGRNGNTANILTHITKILQERLNGFDKFKVLFNKLHYKAKSKKEFESFPISVQESVITHLEKAKARMGNTDYFADGGLIKDVTPTKENEISIYELRLFDPLALRIYFYEKGENVYLGKISRKGAKKEQTNDILSSSSTIKELMLMSN